MPLKKSIWWVSLPGYKPFSMGSGQPITEAEALETVKCIWATTKGPISVR